MKNSLIQSIEELGLQVVETYREDGNPESCEFQCVDSQGQVVVYARGLKALEEWFESCTA